MAVSDAEQRPVYRQKTRVRGLPFCHLCWSPLSAEAARVIHRPRVE